MTVVGGARSTQKNGASCTALLTAPGFSFCATKSALHHARSSNSYYGMSAHAWATSTSNLVPSMVPKRKPSGASMTSQTNKARGSNYRRRTIGDHGQPTGMRCLRPYTCCSAKVRALSRTRALRTGERLAHFAHCRAYAAAPLVVPILLAPPPSVGRHHDNRRDNKDTLATRSSSLKRTLWRAHVSLNANQ